MVRLPKLSQRPSITFRLQHNLQIQLKVTRNHTHFYYRQAKERWQHLATYYLRHCPACQEQQPNQMAHMEPGYCLSKEWSLSPNTSFEWRFPQTEVFSRLVKHRLSKIQQQLEQIDTNFRRSFHN